MHSKLLPVAVASAVNGVLAVSTIASFGLLIFSGRLSGHLSQGIGLLFFSALTVCVGIGLFSSYKGTLAFPNANSAAILAFLAASLSHLVPASVSEETLFLTVVAAIGLSSLLTGIFFFGLGIFKLGGLVRFIPYPVVGGFIAGSGWLLVSGSLEMMAGGQALRSNLSIAFQPATLLQWLPGLIYAFFLWMVARHVKHYLTLPLSLLGGCVLFYAALFFTGTSLADAAGHGFMMGNFPGGALWRPPSPADLAKVDWLQTLQMIPTLGTVALISIISLLLIATGIELSVRQEIGLDHELRIAGLVNIIVGTLGGVAGYHNLTATVLNQRLGANNRWVCVITGGLFGVALFKGAAFLAYVPKQVLGGLLLFFGISFLHEWIIDSRNKLPLFDYLIVLLIVAVIALVGFLPGMAVGMLAGISLFLTQYSKVDVVKHALTGKEYPSRVDRQLEEKQVLVEKADQILILKLLGFIFFGTATSVLELTRQRLSRLDGNPVRFLVLDLRLVSGLDSSAVMGFSRLRQFLQGKGIHLCLTNVTNAMGRAFSLGGFPLQGLSDLRIFDDADHAVEWCEDAILATEMNIPDKPDRTIEEALADLFGHPVPARHFLKYLEKHEYPHRYPLIRQGDRSDCLFFILSGRVTVMLEGYPGRQTRLRSIGTGGIVGEVAFYLGSPRTASVITDMPCIAYRLQSEAMELMETNAPDLAAAFHKAMAQRLAAKLMETDRLLGAILD